MSSKYSLINSKSKKEKYLNQHDLVSQMICKMNIPPPVYFCAIEPLADNQEKFLKLVLECLQREDPSLRVLTDEDNAQLIIQGMGELQFEIVKDRLKREFELDVYFGPLNIAYKEMPTSIRDETFILNKNVGQKKIQIELGLQITPISEDAYFTSVSAKDGMLKEVIVLAQPSSLMYIRLEFWHSPVSFHYQRHS